MASEQVQGGEKVKEVIVDSRINKVLAMRTDSVAMLEALDAISEFYVSNTSDARRMLRQDLELQNISLAKKFLSEFDEVKHRIDSVELLSKNLESACGLLAARVKDADENMKSFMEKASQLENRRNFYETQSDEIQSFLSRFQLSDQEIDLLYHANMDVPDSANAFFDALRRLKSAYDDCKEMVEKHCYSVGFELLEVLGQHQDTAYQHLFGWVKAKCDALAETGSSDDLETNTKLQVSIRFLKKVPIYFDQCQDLLVNSRRTQLVQRFIVALTQGDSSNSSSSSSRGGGGGGGGRGAGAGVGDGSGHASGRALDLQAHDPARYVGGMLAWMHQAVASELEFLEAIFGEPNSSHDRGTRNDSARLHATRSASGKETTALSATGAASAGAGGDGVVDAANEDNDTAEEGRDGTSSGLSIPELLARCLQGLGRPLRVRIMQTLESKAGGLEVLYALTDLLTFYQDTFQRIVPLENAVHSAVKGSLLECRRMFLSALNRQAESLMQSPVSYPLDLKASHVTRECALQVKEVLRVYGAALSTACTDKEDACHLDAVLGNIIQPLLQSCRMGGQALQSAEMAIFMLNNVSVLQHEIMEATKRSKLNLSQESSSWLALLEQEVDTWLQILVQEEVARTLHRSDVDKLLELVEVLPAGLAASEQVGLGGDRVGTVMRSFYASLFSTVTGAQCDRLQDPALRETIRSSTAEKVADAHDKLHAFVSKPENGYQASSILAHSVDEVRVLLGCNTEQQLSQEQPLQ